MTTLLGLFSGLARDPVIRLGLGHDHVKGLGSLVAVHSLESGRTHLDLVLVFVFEDRRLRDGVD